MCLKHLELSSPATPIRRSFLLLADGKAKTADPHFGTDASGGGGGLPALPAPAPKPTERAVTLEMFIFSMPKRHMGLQSI